jgi:hypothetical protein
VPKLDIHCVSSNEYIASFGLFKISIVFYAKHGYIGSFGLNRICIVFRTMDRFIEFSIRIIEHA